MISCGVVIAQDKVTNVNKFFELTCLLTKMHSLSWKNLDEEKNCQYLLQKFEKSYDFKTCKL